jgi:hypothetical protein
MDLSPNFGLDQKEYHTVIAGIARMTETHLKRQVTLHDCLPSLLGDMAKRIEIVYGEEKNILYWADLRGQRRTKMHKKPKKRTNQGRTHFICVL